MIASKYGRVECCKSLISMNKDGINKRNSKGFTALHYAGYEGHIEVTFVLLEAGADPNINNSFGEKMKGIQGTGYVYYEFQSLMTMFYWANIISQLKYVEFKILKSSFLELNRDVSKILVAIHFDID
jgi:ankyrin repeat protein